jgi:hypothetical protein
MAGCAAHLVLSCSPGAVMLTWCCHAHAPAWQRPLALGTTITTIMCCCPPPHQPPQVPADPDFEAYFARPGNGGLAGGGPGLYQIPPPKPVPIVERPLLDRCVGWLGWWVHKHMHVAVLLL